MRVMSTPKVIQGLPEGVPDDLPPIHCVGCGRFIGFSALVLGVVRFFCPKCKAFTTIYCFEGLDNSDDTPYDAGGKAA